MQRYAYQNEKIPGKIVSTKEQEIQWVNPTERKDIYGSTNRLLWNYDDVTGIKTGYTDAAGGCLVASAQKNGVTLIAVVLKTSDSRARFVEGRALLDYGFKHIKEMKIVDEQKLISSIYTHNSTNYKTTVKPIQPFTYLVMDTDNVNDFSWKMNLPAYIDALLKQGAKVGTVDLLYQGNVVGSVDMVTTEEVTEGFNLLGFLHKLFFS